MYYNLFQETRSDAVAEVKVEAKDGGDNLFLPVSDVTLAGVIGEARNLARQFPEVLKSIAADQDRVALAKKKLRCEQKAWSERMTEPLPGMEEFASAEVTAGALGQGRPRMDPEVVLVFFVIAHYFTSVYSGVAAERLLDSLSVYRFLAGKGIAMPGLRTIGDNVNAVSTETRRRILQCQMTLAAKEELDDFGEICGDSTSCAANTRWPTDSGLIYRLISRVFRDSQKLERFSLRNFRVHWMNRWLEELKKLDFAINVAKGGRERRKLYRRYLKISGKAVCHLGDEALALHGRAVSSELPPVLKARLRRQWNRIHQDIHDICNVWQQCQDRVLEGRRVKSSERVLSLADRTAAYILKGDRSPVVGYKPQLGRSRNGLITALLVPEGNRADSEMLVPLVSDAIENTGVVPHLGSFDDGYTSGAGLRALQDLGVRDVSFSGAKGRKLLGDDQWGRDLLKEARRNRSAVESVIFCLKHCHEFGTLRRRGIDAVRDELMGKAIVYNFCRILILRKRQREDRQRAQPA
jgi:IS5 family transposase